MKPRATGLSRARKGSRKFSMFQDLAGFRYQLRLFLRFSENAARKCGITPQQHQLLLGIAGHTGRGLATVSELAEFLQERHHSVVGLIDRAAWRGLVRKQNDTLDKRVVLVSLTSRGEKILSQLSRLHKEEIRRMKAGLLSDAFKAKRG
jgi:DNA-binding MarR family transcriptional regulator